MILFQFTSDLPGIWTIKSSALREGEKVSVTGFKIFYNDKPAVIASQIKTSNDKIELRNPEGFPLWSHWNND